MRHSERSSLLASGPLLSLPGLKHQNIPKVVVPVPPAAYVFFPFLPNGYRIEIAFLKKARGAQQIFRPIPEWTTEPRIDGHPEPHLRPFDQLLRNVFIKHLTKNPHALTVTNLHGKRQPPSNLNDAVIQKWNPGFQGYPHGGAVHLDQNIVR